MANAFAYREGERSFGALWFLRIVGLVLTIITLGLTASSVANFLAIGCNSPSKLSFNLAVTVISFLALGYLILSTGRLSILPWIIFGQLAIDFVLFILWLAAGSTSQLNCDDLCNNACNGIYDFVSYGQEACECNVLFFKGKRNTSPNPARSAIVGKRSLTDENGAGGVATTAFDAILTVLFAVCLAATIFWFFQSRRSGRTGGGHTQTAPPVAGEPIKYEEAGMAAPPAAANYPQAGAPQPMQYQQYDQQPQQQQQQQQLYSQPPYPGQPQMYQQQQPQQPPVQDPTYNAHDTTQAPYIAAAAAAPSPSTSQQPQQQQQDLHRVGVDSHQRTPEMSATGGPMQDPYAHAPEYSTPPPHEGATEMSPISQRTMDGSRAPEVHTPTA